MVRFSVTLVAEAEAWSAAAPAERRDDVCRARAARRFVVDSSIFRDFLLLLDYVRNVCLGLDGKEGALGGRGVIGGAARIYGLGRKKVMDIYTYFLLSNMRVFIDSVWLYVFHVRIHTLVPLTNTSGCKYPFGLPNALR